MYRGVKIAVGRTNRAVTDVLDLARRQVDHLGPAGICSKRDQTNERYEAKGNLRFAPLSRAQIAKLTARIDELGEPAIKVVPFKNPNRPPQR